MTHLTPTLGLRVCDQPWPEIARRPRSLTWTRDPFYCLINAHALTLKAPLVTADTTIHNHDAKAVR